LERDLEIALDGDAVGLMLKRIAESMLIVVLQALVLVCAVDQYLDLLEEKRRMG
jgi:hypothetical protein